MQVFNSIDASNQMIQVVDQDVGKTRRGAGTGDCLVKPGDHVQ